MLGSDQAVNDRYAIVMTTYFDGSALSTREVGTFGYPLDSAGRLDDAVSQLF